MSSLSQLLIVLVATFPFLSVCGVHEEHLMIVQSSCVWAFSFSFLSRDGAYFPKIAMKLWTLCLKSNTKKKFNRVEVFVLLTASGCLYKDRDYHVLYLQCLTHSQLVSPICSHFYLQISYSFSVNQTLLDLLRFEFCSRSFLLKKNKPLQGMASTPLPQNGCPESAGLLNCWIACFLACLLACC